MLIFFYGADSFRINRAVKEIKNKFIKEINPEETAVSIIDGESIEKNDLLKELSLNSLFAEKKLLIVNNIFKSKKEVIFSDLLTKLNYLETEKNIITVFKEEQRENEKKSDLNLKGAKKKCYETLVKQVYSQEFKKLNNNGLKLFIKKELEKYRKEISLEAAEILIKYFKDDLWLLSSELKKTALSSDEKIITKKEIVEIVKEVFDENIFALSDAISSKNKSLILSTLEKQKLSGLSNEQILASLRNYFKNLLLIKMELEKNNDSLKIANKLKIHPFVVKKSLNQARSFNKDLLKKYFNHLVEIDYLNKKGFSSLENELFLLISEF